MALKQLSKIGRRTKYCVYGWIREKENSLKLRNVPHIISVLCILYLREDEIFMINGRGIKLSENRKSITMVGPPYLVSNYGIVEIPSVSNSICKWRVKAHDVNGCGVDLGIIAYQPSNLNHPKVTYKFSTGMQWGLKRSKNGSAWIKYGGKWIKDDEITLCLDLTKLEIKVMINDKDQGIAIGNIEKSKKIYYRFFVTLSSKNNCVEILNFTEE